jgi:ATP-dependent Clp protease adaptor protein ClpS
LAEKVKTIEKTKIDVKLPKNYKVLLLNDDFTSMDFVVEVLMSIFHYDVKDATTIMLKVHHEGRAICGIYPFEIAEMKVAQVHSFARANNFPLKAVFEED